MRCRATSKKLNPLTPEQKRQKKELEAEMQCDHYPSLVERLTTYRPKVEEEMRYDDENLCDK